MPLHEALIFAVEEVNTYLKGDDKEILRKVFCYISHFETLPPWETLGASCHPFLLWFFSIREKLLIDNFILK